MIVTRVLRGRVRLWRNALITPLAAGGARGLRHPLVAAGLVAAMSVVSYLGFRALLESLRAGGATPNELSAALGAALGAAIVALLVFDLDAVAATLLLDRDLALLRAAPLAPRAIFALKLLDAAPRTILPLAVLALPALAAFASVCAIAPPGWLALPLIAGCLWVVAFGCGLALVLPLLAVAPPHRVREALGLIATLTVTSVWLVNALALPRLVDQGQAATDRLRENLLHPSGLAGLSPGQHAARMMLGLSERAWRTAAIEILLLLAAAAAAAALAAWSASRFLPVVLDRVAAPPSHAHAPRPRIDRTRHHPRGVLRALLARDARLLTRDWTALADVVTAAALWTLLPFISRAVLDTDSTLLARTMLAALAIGLGYELGARALPFERRGAAWMALAPVAAGSWLQAKLIGIAAVAAPILLFASAMLMLSLKLRPLEAVAALAGGAAAFSLSAGIGLWTGARFGDLKWTHHRAMLTLPGRLAAAGFMVVQLVLWLGIAALSQALDGTAAGPVWRWAPVLIAPLLAIIPIVACGRRLTRLGSQA